MNFYNTLGRGGCPWIIEYVTWWRLASPWLVFRQGSRFLRVVPISSVRSLVHVLDKQWNQ